MAPAFAADGRSAYERTVHEWTRGVHFGPAGWPLEVFGEGDAKRGSPSDPIGARGAVECSRRAVGAAGSALA